MKVKCRGYTGDLIYLNETEECRAICANDWKPVRYTLYEIRVLSDDGAEIVLHGVRDNEIEVTHEN